MKIVRKRNFLTIGASVLLVATGIFGVPQQIAHATTFTVTNTDNSGAGSLRQAITDAEAAPGADVIEFNIAGSGPHIISLTTALPNMAQQTTIEGCTEPDADCSGFPAQPSVQVDFSGVATNSNGFGFFDTADGSIVRGLSIVGNDAGALSNAIGINDADNMIVEQNLIGLAIDGTANANRYGIVAYGTDSLQLGTAGRGNVISGNNTAGVITDPSPADAISNVTNFSMKGNWVGLGLDGIAARPNTGAPAPTTTVGGIYIGNGNSNNGATIGGATAAERNVFAASGRSSLEIAPFTNVSVQSNYFETTADGMQVISTGLVSFGGTGHLSVAFNPGTQNNVDIRDNIFGNVGIGGGVYSTGISTNPTSITNGLVVQHNQFGIASNGTSTLRANDTDLYHGISVYQTPDAVIGGPNSADRNYFSNTGSAIYAITPGGVDIENNYINFDTNGNPINVPMTLGVFVGTGDGHQIINNRIGRIATAGIRLSNTGLSVPTNTVIQGNYIGTTVDGMAKATPTNSAYGIIMAGDDTLIGGTTPSERNVISGNAIGIGFAGSRTTITGNYIGVASDGTTPIVTGNGAVWASGAIEARIGGIGAGEGNIIANSTYGGILVDDVTSHSERVSIRGNSIYANGALGINLEAAPATLNATPNDDGDGDTGGNNLQNFPVFNRVEGCDGSTQQRGSLNSAANTTYNIDFYTTAEGFTNPSYPDEGRTYHSTTTVNTDGSGNGTFTLPSGVNNLSMTATDPDGNTSEFGNIRDITVTNCAVTELSTQDTTPPVMGEVDITGVTNPSLTVTVDGQTVPATYNSGAGTWSVADGALSELAIGVYDFTLTVTDPVTNLSTSHTQIDALTIHNDSDGDGVSDEEENIAPGNDGNGDGIDDSTQANVATVINSATGAYTTLAIGDAIPGNSNVDCNQILNYEVHVESVLAKQDSTYSYPVGMNAFTLECVNPGDTATVRVYYDKEYDTSDWVWRKYSEATQEYRTVKDIEYGTALVNGTRVTTVTYDIVDGDSLDEDGVANGIIVDPSGPGVAPAPNAPDTGFAQIIAALKSVDISSAAVLLTVVSLISLFAAGVLTVRLYRR